MFVSKQAQDVFRITNLFIPIPALHCYNSNLPFACCLVATFVVSVLNWKYFIHGSLMHHLDKVAVCVTLACVFVQDTGLMHCIPVLLLTHICGRHRYYTQKPKNAAQWHCVFRYVAFWICYFHATKGVGILAFCLYSIVYVRCCMDLFVF